MTRLTFDFDIDARRRFVAEFRVWLVLVGAALVIAVSSFLAGMAYGK